MDEFRGSIANSASFTFASFSNELFVIVVFGEPPNKKKTFIWENPPTHTLNFIDLGLLTLYNGQICHKNSDL